MFYNTGGRLSMTQCTFYSLNYNTVLLLVSLST